MLWGRAWLAVALAAILAGCGGSSARPADTDPEADAPEVETEDGDSEADAIDSDELDPADGDGDTEATDGDGTDDGEPDDGTDTEPDLDDGTGDDSEEDGDSEEDDGEEPAETEPDAEADGADGDHVPVIEVPEPMALGGGPVAGAAPLPGGAGLLLGWPYVRESRRHHLSPTPVPRTEPLTVAPPSVGEVSWHEGQPRPPFRVGGDGFAVLHANVLGGGPQVMLSPLAGGTPVVIDTALSVHTGRLLLSDDGRNVLYGRSFDPATGRFGLLMHYDAWTFGRRIVAADVVADEPRFVTATGIGQTFIAYRRHTGTSEGGELRLDRADGSGGRLLTARAYSSDVAIRADGLAFAFLERREEDPSRLDPVEWIPDRNERRVLLGGALELPADGRAPLAGLAALTYLDSSRLLVGLPLTDRVGSLRLWGILQLSIDRLDTLISAPALAAERSPDGAWLLLAAPRGQPGGTGELWLVDLAHPGTPARLVSRRLAGTARFAQGGRYVLFVANMAADPVTERYLAVYAHETAGGGYFALAKAVSGRIVEPTPDLGHLVYDDDEGMLFQVTTGLADRH